MQVDAAVAGGGDSGWAEREREREETERAERERAREKERERELECERVERERRREAELAKEVVKEREREKERERADASKAGMAVQRSSKSAKTENGRAQKGERAGMQCFGCWREWSGLWCGSNGVGVMMIGGFAREKDDSVVV